MPHRRIREKARVRAPRVAPLAISSYQLLRRTQIARGANSRRLAFGVGERSRQKLARHLHTWAAWRVRRRPGRGLLGRRGRPGQATTL
jgi:hypothetical protein